METRYLELSITVEIRPSDYATNGLRISETHKIKAGNFLELCEILGKFHKLTEEITQE